MTTLPEGAARERLNFFSELEELSDFSDVVDPERFHDAPASWFLALTDVRGSTRAIEAGRYRDVNALGVASIVAVCNATPELELPYLFGGDGATLLVPGSRLAAYECALRGVARTARLGYDLELRIGMVAVAELMAAGHAVRVARYRASEHVRLAMFAGSGFSQAERWLKDPNLAARYTIAEGGDASASFEGFECRWQPVHSRHGSILSLLVQALAADERARSDAYRRVLGAVQAANEHTDGKPLSERQLKLRAFGGDFSSEARLRSASAAGPAYEDAKLVAQKKARIGKFLIGLGASAGGFHGKSYRRELVENTDFRKFDETLRMVLDLHEDKLHTLQGFLDRERAAGHIAYGLHRAPSALVTCFVRSYAGNHVHFVDGADGGYALAAKQLKSQLAARLA